MARSLAWCVLAAWLLVPAAAAQQILLDEEFTQACQTMAAPLRATLAPQTRVAYVLVNSPEINAFVTPENIVYLNSGLVLKAKSASEVQGVIAHELGHIQGNHIYQRQGQMQQSMLGAMAGGVLGLGAAMAGAPQVGGAIMVGSQAGAITQMLAYTRTQEQEADRYAVSALHNAGYSAAGMVGMFTTLRTESQLSYNAPPQWLVTHPLPPERLSSLANVTAQESPSLKQQPEGVDFPRLQAKVAALTGAPASVLRIYSNPADPVARYARTIAFLNQGKLKQAQESLTPLLEKSPADPFYQELAATIATQQGKLEEAETILARLTSAHQSWLMFRYQYAEVLRARNKPKEAMANYERITRAWPEWSEPWRGLGLTYGQQNRLTESHLALTEAAYHAYDKIAARQSLALAKTYLTQSPNADLDIWAKELEDRLKRLPDPQTPNR